MIPFFTNTKKKKLKCSNPIKYHVHVMIYGHILIKIEKCDFRKCVSSVSRYPNTHDALLVSFIKITL